MTTPPVPPESRVPLAVTIGILTLALPLSAARGGLDDARAAAGDQVVDTTVHAAASDPVDAATSGRSGPGATVEQRVVAAAVQRGERRAVPPPPDGRLADQGAALLDALGLDHAVPVTHADLLRAADTLRVATDGWVREEHLDAMLEAFLQRAEPALVGLGIPHGERVTVDDVRVAAGTIGLDVGSSVDPADVNALLHEAATHRGGPTPRFAVVAGINVRLPTRVPLMAGFHQASYRNAIGMRDAGHGANRTLPSRGRGTSRSSAVDVRVPPNTLVLAPIRGTVVEVTPYALYGKYPDWKIRMVPESDPGLLVTVLHVSDPKVRVGQQLEAGDPLAGRATLFPFESQIDRFSGRGPHVHIEARRR